MWVKFVFGTTSNEDLKFKLYIKKKRNNQYVLGILGMGVKDPRYYPKSSGAQEKTHGHVQHLDLELSDRSRE